MAAKLRLKAQRQLAKSQNGCTPNDDFNHIFGAPIHKKDNKFSEPIKRKPAEKQLKSKDANLSETDNLLDKKSNKTAEINRKKEELDKLKESVPDILPPNPKKSSRKVKDSKDLEKEKEKKSRKYRDREDKSLSNETQPVYRVREGSSSNSIKNPNSPTIPTIILSKADPKTKFNEPGKKDEGKQKSDRHSHKHKKRDKKSKEEREARKDDRKKSHKSKYDEKLLKTGLGSTPQSERSSPPPTYQDNQGYYGQMYEDTVEDQSKLTVPNTVEETSPSAPSHSESSPHSIATSPLHSYEDLAKIKEKEDRNEEHLRKKERKERRREKRYSKEQDKKRKRKKEEKEVDDHDDPPNKLEKLESVDNGDNLDDNEPVLLNKPAGDVNVDYMTMLNEIRDKIAELTDETHLEKVVRLVLETGQYVVTNTSFDFDLVHMEKDTVSQIQSILS